MKHQHEGNMMSEPNRYRFPACRVCNLPVVAGGTNGDGFCRCTAKEWRAWADRLVAEHESTGEAMKVRTKHESTVHLYSWTKREIGFDIRGHEVLLELTDSKMRAFPIGTDIEVVIALRHAGASPC